MDIPAKGHPMAPKRSIFEDVSDTNTDPDKPQTGIISQGGQGSRGALKLWLKLLFVLVMIMIVVGGLTRLTDSRYQNKTGNPNLPATRPFPNFRF